MICRSSLGQKCFQLFSPPSSFIFYHLSKAINIYYFSKQRGKSLSPVGHFTLHVVRNSHTSLPVILSCEFASEQSTCLWALRLQPHAVQGPLHTRFSRVERTHLRVQGDEGDVVADVLAS